MKQLEYVDLYRAARGTRITVETVNGEVFYLTARGNGVYEVGFSESAAHYRNRVGGRQVLYKVTGGEDEFGEVLSIVAGGRLVLAPSARQSWKTATVTCVIVNGRVASQVSIGKAMAVYLAFLTCIVANLGVLVACAWHARQHRDAVIPVVVTVTVMTILCLMGADRHAWARPRCLAWLTD